MMLCVDKKTLHEPLPDHEFGQLRTVAGKQGHGPREHPHHAQAGPVPAEEQLRHDVMTRVVRISGALNQRLAL
jgi:hypothetical protein